VITVSKLPVKTSWYEQHQLSLTGQGLLV